MSPQPSALGHDGGATADDMVADGDEIVPECLSNSPLKEGDGHPQPRAELDGVSEAHLKRRGRSTCVGEAYARGPVSRQGVGRE